MIKHMNTHILYLYSAIVFTFGDLGAHKPVASQNVAAKDICRITEVLHDQAVDLRSIDSDWYAVAPNFNSTSGTSTANVCQQHCCLSKGKSEFM